MRRRAWRILVTVSVVLLVATAGVWAWGSTATVVILQSHDSGVDGETLERTTYVGWRRGGLAVGVTAFTLWPVADDDEVTLRGPRPLNAQVPLWGIDPAALAEVPDARYRWGFAWHRQYPVIVNPGAVIRRRDDGHLYRVLEDTSVMVVPAWFLAPLFALAPARALYTFRKKRRRPPHCCRACGYDLRATADPAGPRLATCPECGRAAAVATRD